MKANHYAAIILAAGFSSRMKYFKPLLPVGGETITDRIIATFLQNGVEICLVVGWQQHELRAGIKTQNVRIAENPDYQQGMFTSVQAGLRYMQDMQADYKAFFVIPVDIPLVRPFTIRCLLAAAEERPGKIFYPEFRGKRGHPPLIPGEMVPDILDWQKGGNLKAVLDANEKIAVRVKVPDCNILFDIDDPADYEKLLERFQHYEVPTEEECEVILTDVCRIADDVRRHCFKVADVASAIGRALLTAGQSLNLDVIHAAAILHDIGKGQPNHDAAGERMLREMGFGRIGDIVAVHTDLPEGTHSGSLESKVVYLADKYVTGEMVNSLENRYESAIRRFGATPTIKANIIQRKERALSVRKELEVLLGHSLEAVIL